VLEKIPAKNDTHFGRKIHLALADGGGIIVGKGRRNENSREVWCFTGVLASGVSGPSFRASGRQEHEGIDKRGESVEP